jgi:hypothetical protein
MKSETQKAGLSILNARLADGTIYLDGSTYVGRATDGVEVQIGDTTAMRATLAYLVDHPTPDTW